MASTSSKNMWGRHEHSLDEKGRLVMPQRFREVLGDEFVLTIGPGNHIRVYPTSVWEAMEPQLIGEQAYDDLDPNMIFLQRMYGNCDFVSYDAQNRVSIPRHLREWASLREGDYAAIIGSGRRLEIWNRTEWERYIKGFTEQNAARAASLHWGVAFNQEPASIGATMPSAGSVSSTAIDDSGDQLGQ